MNRRIGIFRGTFDPIHDGHVAFALEAIKTASLDKVYFLVEHSPSHKTAVSDLRIRKNIIARTISNQEGLHLLSKFNANGYIKDILPKLRKIFGDSTLVFLMGSDIAKTIDKWPDTNLLCEHNELIIGLRNSDTTEDINKVINSLSKKPANYYIIGSPLPHMTSSKIKKLKTKVT